MDDEKKDFKEGRQYSFLTKAPVGQFPHHLMFVFVGHF